MRFEPCGVFAPSTRRQSKKEKAICNRVAFFFFPSRLSPCGADRFAADLQHLTRPHFPAVPHRRTLSI
jgi:hypothetical protein